MIERLVHRLSYSSVRPLRRLFSGGPPPSLETDPQVQERIIASVEKRVYGSEGLVGYEQRDSSPRQRAARRSLAQHLGQRAQYSTWGLRTARTAAFWVLLPFIFAYILLDSLRKRRPAPQGDRTEVVVFFWAQRLEKFVWDGMFEDRRYTLHTTQEMYLGGHELWYGMRGVIVEPRMLRHPELLSNFVRWLAYYGFARRRYEPAMIAHFFESTASSSLMTAYLHQFGIRHCDIQHGELRFGASCAFAEFDEYRLWGEHSRELLARQRSPKDRMRVVGVPFHRELFRRVRPSQQPRPPRMLIIDAFLSADPSLDEMTLRVLRALTSSWEVRLRRHPADQSDAVSMHRWNADQTLQSRRIRVEEERPHDVLISEAIGRSRIVVGVSSAALLEAWFAGCKVIYLPGGPSRDAVMKRHGGSPNVCHLADEPALARFLAEPALLDDAESRRVNYLTAVLD